MYNKIVYTIQFMGKKTYVIFIEEHVNYLEVSRERSI